MTGARPICGDCPDCLERTNALLRVPVRASGLPGPAPTVAALERHAEKFDSLMVAETAAEFGLTVDVATYVAPRRRRRRRS